MQAVSHIQVQMGRRSLDLPLNNVSRLPSLSVLRHHTRTFFPLPANQNPMLLHDGTQITNEDRWSTLLSNGGHRTLRLHLQTESLASGSEQSFNVDEDPEVQAVQACEESAIRTDYFAVQGQTGNTTLYLEKADFDRRMTEFAREGSLTSGMRAIFPPKHKDEYTELFRAMGAEIVVTTEAIALLQSWHKKLAIGGGIVAGGLAGGLIAASSLGGAAEATAVAGLAAEGAGAALAAEATAAALATEATAGSGGAAAGAAVGAGIGAAATASAVAAVAVGYLTFRGLKWLLPEIGKEPYTILMSVPAEDSSMLEMGRQMSIVESSTGPSCGICMERPQDAAAVPCGHTACSVCMEQLVRRHGSAGTPCPHCRKPIASVQRIFLG